MIRITGERVCLEISIDEIYRYTKRSIIVSEDKGKPYFQKMLIDLGGKFIWSNFYTNSYPIHKEFPSIEAAMIDRMSQGDSIYILQNKTELKEFIKPKN